jgi:hypothetical protein
MFQTRVGFRFQRIHGDRKIQAAFQGIGVFSRFHAQISSRAKQKRRQTTRHQRFRAPHGFPQKGKRLFRQAGKYSKEFSGRMSAKKTVATGKRQFFSPVQRAI